MYNLKKIFENKSVLIPNDCIMNSYYAKDYSIIIMYCKHRKIYILYNKTINQLVELTNLNFNDYKPLQHCIYNIRDRKIRNQIFNVNKKYVLDRLSILI